MATSKSYPTYHFYGFTFSGGNAKLGECISFSTSCLSCDPSAPCFKKCYANRLAAFRKNVAKSYDTNYELAFLRLDLLEKACEKAFALADALEIPFRWHVSGDIMNAEYFAMMVRLSNKFQNVKVIAMTKQYAIVNDWIAANGIEALPENLRKGLAFSAWPGFPMPNPYALPIAGFIPKGEEIGKRFVCPNQTTKKLGKTWTCSDCAKHGIGCFSGEDRNFTEH